MTVAENVEYGMRVRKVLRRRSGRSAEPPRRWRWSAARLRERKPGELSGGQRQRVALARAIVNRPRVLLLDEPLGALDLKLREQMQVELKAIQSEVGITFIYVTHDQDEALTMSDRIAVFNEGRVEQVGRTGRDLRAPGDPASWPASWASRTCSSAMADGSRSGPRRSRLLEPARTRTRVCTPSAGWIRDVAYAGMMTRYLVQLDEGGELQVVRQNLETSSAEALEQRGRKVIIGWRPEHAVAVQEETSKWRTPVRAKLASTRRGSPG